MEERFPVVRGCGSDCLKQLWWVQGWSLAGSSGNSTRGMVVLGVILCSWLGYAVDSVCCLGDGGVYTIGVGLAQPWA